MGQGKDRLMIDSLIAATLSPGFAIYWAIIALVGLIAWRAARRPHEPDWFDLKRAKCAETGHKLVHAPRASLALGEILPRFPGLYAETVCACQLRQRRRLIGITSSKAAEDFRRKGK